MAAIIIAPPHAGPPPTQTLQTLQALQQLDGEVDRTVERLAAQLAVLDRERQRGYWELARARTAKNLTACPLVQVCVCCVHHRLAAAALLPPSRPVTHSISTRTAAAAAFWQPQPFGSYSSRQAAVKSTRTILHELLPATTLPAPRCLASGPAAKQTSAWRGHSGVAQLSTTVAAAAIVAHPHRPALIRAAVRVQLLSQLGGLPGRGGRQRSSVLRLLGLRQLWRCRAVCRAFRT